MCRFQPLFEVFGRVIDVRINPNRTRDSTSKNYGFVTFEDSTAVANCLKNKVHFYKSTNFLLMEEIIN